MNEYPARMNRPNLFQGRSVRLAALTKDDAATLAQWHEDAEFLRLYDSRPAYPKGEAELEKWLEELQKDRNTFAFAVRSVEDDGLLGYLELDGVDWQHGVCWMGLGIGERGNWGRGHGREAAELALRFDFHELNLHRVQVTVFSYNERSMALFEKLGFRREGVFRERLRRDGKRYDMILYGLLRHEWEAQHGADRATGR